MELFIKERLNHFKKGEVPNGYIKTNGGIFPQDWKIAQMQEFVRVFRGASPRPKGDPKYYGGNIPRLMIEDVTRDGKYVFPLIDSLTEEGAKKSRFLPKDSVVLSCSGTRVAIPGILGVDACIHDGFFGFDNYKELLPEYFYYYFEYLHEQMQSSATKGGVFNNLTTQIMKEMVIQVPHLEEQREIINILRAWDKAIELKEKLIKQKKEQKKGLMQKLLTGEVRLEGFNGDWQEFNLGNIGKTYNGLSGKTADDFGTGKPYIPYKAIFDDSKIDLKKVDYVTIHEGEKQNSGKKGDIFFTTSSETPDEVGMSSVLLDDIDEIYLNSFCFGYRLNNFNLLSPEFAQYYFRNHDFRKKIYALAQGSTRFNISKNEVMKILIKIPSLKEQKFIATILTSSDKEIKLLLEELSILNEQKKGLMQLLLTGKVRVKV